MRLVSAQGREARPGGKATPTASGNAKKGSTDNGASADGFVKSAVLHRLVAELATLGRRFAPHQRCATIWRLPALGAAVERIARSAA